ncbi:MAG: general secretion pathway protein GspB [Gammaproteobacteria bacterium]|nr:general secretion pathway protein GspB [Gammaproteobacteria bacterium]
MSLILEALRKSDLKNQAAETRALLSRSEQITHLATNPPISLYVILILLLVATCLFALNAIAPQSLPASNTAQKHPLTPLSSEVGPINTDFNSTTYIDNMDLTLSFSGQPKPITKPSYHPTFTNSAAPSSHNSDKKVSIDAGEIISIPVHQLPQRLVDTPHVTELPAKTSDAIPALSYESHWYAPRADKRTVIINGRNLREGATLSDGLIIRAITKKGAILSYKGELFHLLMLQTWPNPQ